ncbi:uncharacterized protein [Cicer arietinum]|uniref:uncharacterized protein isoform X2 n=1 Tax=Cicer arietinum TaxID=3827 RepID=UPI003CC5D006
MPPKKKTRVKHPLKKNGMILPDIVAQVAQQVQAAVDQSPLDDDATTLAPLYGWRPTQGHVKLYTQQVVGPPPQPNEMPPKKKSRTKHPLNKNHVILPYMVSQTAQQMPPKKKIRVKHPLKKNRVILPHMVSQTNQQVQAAADQSPLDDDATTLTPQCVWRRTQRHVKPPTQQVAVPPSQPNEVDHSEPTIVMMPTLGLVSMDTMHPSREDHISPSSTTNHSPSQPLTSFSSQHTSVSTNPSCLVPAPRGNRTKGSRYSRPIPETAPDGRPLIHPDGRGWLPCRVASRALTSVITSQYSDPYPSWGAIPPTMVECWFEKFGEKVAWLPEHDFQIRNIFKTKGSMRLSEILMEARNKRKRPSWMDESVWKELERIWMDPSYKKISVRAKKNRASCKGGSVHTCGSISVAEHTIRMAEELGRDPTLDEIFVKTHTKKDSSWVDDRAKKSYESFQDKLQKASQVEDASGSGSQAINPAARLDIWVQSVGGKNRGRIYGAGDRSSLYRPGVKCLTPDSRPSKGCSNVLSQYSGEVAAQIAAFEERAKAAEDEAREAREELRQVEQRRQEEVHLAEQRTAKFQRQLASLANSVASIQAESSRRRRRRRHRHRDYDEYESTSDESEDY